MPNSFKLVQHIFQEEGDKFSSASPSYGPDSVQVFYT